MEARIWAGSITHMYYMARIWQKFFVYLPHTYSVQSYSRGSKNPLQTIHQNGGPRLLFLSFSDISGGRIFFFPEICGSSISLSLIISDLGFGSSCAEEAGCLEIMLLQMRHFGFKVVAINLLKVDSPNAAAMLLDTLLRYFQVTKF
jgi:hypothetical protein